MQEDTATLRVSLTITLTAEAGATPEQPTITAEDKAESTLQLIRDQVEAIKRTYDTGVDVSGKVSYVGRDEESL